MTTGFNPGLPSPQFRPEPSVPRKPIHQVVGKGPAWKKTTNPELDKIKPLPPTVQTAPLRKPVVSTQHAMHPSTPDVVKKNLAPGTHRPLPSSPLPGTRSPQLTRNIAARPLPSRISPGPSKPIQPLLPSRVTPQGKPLVPPRLGNMGRPLPLVQKAPPITFDKLLANNYTPENIRIAPPSDKAANFRDSQVLGFLTTNINFQKQMKNTHAVIGKILSMPEPIQKRLLADFNTNNGGNLQIADLTQFLTHISHLEKTLDGMNKDLLSTLNKHGVLSDKHMTDPIVVDILAVFSKHKDALFGQVTPIANHPHYVDMQNFLNEDNVKVIVKTITPIPNAEFIQVTSATSRYRTLFDPIVEKMPPPHKEQVEKYSNELREKLTKMNSFDPRLNVRLLANQSQFSTHDLSDIHKFLLTYDGTKDKGDTIDVKFAQTLLKHIQDHGLENVVKDKLETMSWKYTLALHSFLGNVSKTNPGLLPADSLKSANAEIKKFLQKTSDRIKSKKILNDLNKPIDTQFIFKKEFDTTQAILKSKI